MLRLYKGSASQEIQLVKPASALVSSTVKRNVIRYLADAHNREAADVLEKHDFELWAGRNDWHDEFELLYLRATAKAYLQFEEEVDTERKLWRYKEIAQAYEKLHHPLRFIAVDINTDDVLDTEAVAQPDLTITSAVVERALTDAQLLITANGATSGLDRVHTALHGYLKLLCNDANIKFQADAGITDLFKLIRKSHPALQYAGPRNQDIGTILNAMASIVSALDPIRNRSSVAHANELLLDEPEATLVINAVHTLLHYLHKKLG